MAWFKKSLLFLTLLLLFGNSLLLAKPASAADAWADTTFQYRKKITFNNASSSEDLTSFPVAIVLNSSNIDYSKTNNDGSDIRFVDSNGTTTIYHEIEKWNESATSTLWVKVPTINGTSSADYIYMYYGSSTATSTASGTNVWDSNFISVWHLSENPAGTSPQGQNSTQYDYDVSTAGGMLSNDLITGTAGDAWDFDVNDQGSTSDNDLFDLTTNVTLESWFKTSDTNSSGDPLIVHDWSSYKYMNYITGGTGALQFYVRTTTGVSLANYNPGSGTLANNRWHQMIGIYNKSASDGQRLKLYFDGIFVTSSAGYNEDILSGDEGININKSLTGNNYVGALDELRISSSTRSASWIYASYLSGSNTFNSFSSEEVTPRIQFSTSSSSGSESTTTATLVLELSATSTDNVTVQYSVQASSTAIGSGTDYTLSNGTSTITAGNSTTSISILINNDNADELDEILVVGLSTSVGAIFATNTQHVYTIQDNDPPPTIAFELSTSTISESTTTSTIIIALSASSSFVTTVQYTIQASSTATGSGTDYTLANGTSTISAGNTTTSIQVSIINDSDVESSELLVLRLSNPASSTLGSVTDHVLTITDNDSYPEVYFTSSTHAGAESSNATILVQLSATSSVTSTLTFSTSGTATYALDYSLSTTTVTISPGFSTTSFTLTILNDSLDELDETVILTITTSTNSTIGSTSTLTYTIQDNDPPPTIQFQATSSSGSEASSPVSLVIELSASSSFVTTVQYTIQASSTAVGSGTDYTLANGTSTIQAGNTTTSISLSITDDSLYESNEIVVIQLAAPASSTLGTNTQFIYTITENDSAPTISFSLATSSVAESTATATIIIALSASSSFITTVQYRALATSTATGSGTDFTLTEGTSTISAGNTTTSILFTIINDSLDESDETVIIQIHTAVSSTMGSTSTLTYTITDDDEAVVESGNSSPSPNPTSGGGSSAPSYIQKPAESKNIHQESRVLTLPPLLVPIAISNPELLVRNPLFPRPLKLGDIGEDVKRLQVFLNQNGFKIAESGPGSPGLETTKFGALTKLALAKFQEANKQSLDITQGTGILGPKTLAFFRMMTQSKSPDLSQTTNTPSPIIVQDSKQKAPAFLSRSLKQGDSGEDVKLLQEVLAKNKNIYPEGIASGFFGPKTAEAVKRFQLLNQIAGPDDIAFGFVGPKTRTLLNILVKEE